MGRFHIREHLDAHVISDLVGTNPRLREVVARVGREHGLPEPRARRFVERLLTVVMDGFGETHLSELSARLDRINSIRERITALYDSVLRGEGLPPGASPVEVEGLFNRLESEMNSLKSASDTIRENGTLIREDVRLEEAGPSTEGAAIAQGGPLTRRPLAEVVGDSTGLSNVSAPSRAVLEDVAASAPDLIGRAIRSPDEGALNLNKREVAEFMRGRERSEAEIARAMEAIKEANLARNRELRRSRPEPGSGTFDPTTPQGRLRLEAMERFQDRARELRERRAADPSFQPTAAEQAIIDAAADPGFFDAARANAHLARLLHESPERLAELWAAYKQSGSQRAFGTYVLGVIMRGHMVGLSGEYRATFLMGDSMAIVKGPDFNVTEGGTDAVAIMKSTGETWLTDNKALQEANVSGVTSLVENILQNMEADAAEFQPIAAHADTPQYVRDAIQRHADATRDLRTYLATNPGDITSTPVQQHITQILGGYNIRRVVTNAGGQVTGLSAGLQQLGIELRNFR